MIRTILSLGKTPVSRRIVAALVLLAAATGASVMRKEGQVLTIDMASNLVIAGIAFGLLHLRWRKREARDLTPKKLKDTFS